MQELSFQIRDAHIDDVRSIAYIHVESWRSTYAGILPDDYLKNLAYQEREDLWAKVLSQADADKHVFVAIDLGTKEVIGFASGGPARGELTENCKGEIYAIYLLKSYQGLGIGQQLFEASRYHLNSQELIPFGLNVLTKNPSCAFYEKMGGRVIAQITVAIDGNLFEEQVYAWDE